MDRKTLRILVPLFLAALAVGVSGYAVAQTAQTELSKKDTQWLEEEVAALITAQETSIFKEIDKKDRKLFQELFWARRDPNPATKDNEFQKEYQARVKNADRDYKTQGKKGSTTDMGKIFLLLGAPSRTEQGADQTTSWIYDPNPDHGIPEGLTIRFQGNALAAGAEDLEKTFERVKARYITNPAVMYARSPDGKLLEPRGTSVDPNSPASLVMNTLRQTQTVTSDVPFQNMFAYFRASENSVYIPILFDVDGKAITWEADAADMTVFGVVENVDGHVIYQFEEPAKIQKAKDGRTLYEIPIQLQPGQYKLYLGVRDNKSSSAGTKITPLEVPDFGTGDLVVSTVVVYNEGKEVTEPAGTPGHAFQFGPVKFQPASRFTKADTFGLFFFVYGHGLDAQGKPNITGQYIFYREGTKKGQTKDGPLQADARQAVGNAEIPLSGFEPGSYKMEVKVTDHVHNKTITKGVEFVVEGGANP